MRFVYNILICDDDRDIVSALKIYLSGQDYNLFAAYSGTQALEVLREHDIQLILMTSWAGWTSRIPALSSRCRFRVRRGFPAADR